MTKNSANINLLKAVKDNLDFLKCDFRFNEMTLGAVAMQHSADQSACVTANFIVESETGKKHGVFTAEFTPKGNDYSVSCEFELSSGEPIAFNKDEIEMSIYNAVVGSSDVNHAEAV